VTRPWRPAAAAGALRARAELLARVRSFFAQRGVMEVETPVLGAGANPDPHVESLPPLDVPGAGTLWLQTSPEFAMKRLLAAGSGPIYQIARAFRANEIGRLHNPEFTLLEWYRPGFDHHALMDEIAALIAHVLELESSEFERLSYGEALRRFTDVDAGTAPSGELKACLHQHGVALPRDLTRAQEEDRDLWLDLLMAEVVAPNLGALRPCFIYDYPASQAALARVRPGSPPLAERFELYARGVELANGFHELSDASEQARRFAHDQRRREQRGQHPVALDQALIDALQAGLPDCAGVALGLDRLLMLKLDARRLDEVLAFPCDRA